MQKSALQWIPREIVQKCKRYVLDSDGAQNLPDSGIQRCANSPHGQERQQVGPEGGNAEENQREPAGAHERVIEPCNQTQIDKMRGRECESEIPGPRRQAAESRTEQGSQCAGGGGQPEQE